MADRIAVPAKSKLLLTNLIGERDKVIGLIDAALAGVRSALDVPDGWILQDLEAGFAPPADVADVELTEQMLKEMHDAN